MLVTRGALGSSTGQRLSRTLKTQEGRGRDPLTVARGARVPGSSHHRGRGCWPALHRSDHGSGAQPDSPGQGGPLKVEGPARAPARRPARRPVPCGGEAPDGGSGARLSVSWSVWGAVCPRAARASVPPAGLGGKGHCRGVQTTGQTSHCSQRDTETPFPGRSAQAAFP